MSLNKFWVSEKGRTASLYLMGFGSGCTFGGYLYFHTFGVERWKQTVHLYKNGFPTPVTKNVQILVDKVVEDVKLGDRSQKYLKIFTVYGFDVFHAGSTKLRFGALVGLPRNFSYNTKADIERHDIMVENKPVEWGSEDGELLQESLLVSENAQKFAIAREIYMSDTNYVYANGFVHSGAIALCYTLSSYLNDKFYGLYKPRSFRIVLYSMVSTFVFGVWSVTKDILTKYYENSADSQAASLDLSYAKGGVEYYAKILQRNIALRALMGPKGENQYTAYGNDVEFIRQRHVPYTVRKDNLIKAVKNFNATASSNLKTSDSKTQLTI